MDTDRKIENIANTLSSLGTTAASFVLTLLDDPLYHHHSCTTSLTGSSNDIIEAFSRHPLSEKSTFAWAANVVKRKYSASVKELARNEDWHFNASHASAQALEDFRIEDMAADMKKLAPDLWDIISIMLDGDRRKVDCDGDQVMDGNGPTESIDNLYGESDPNDEYEQFDESGLLDPCESDNSKKGKRREIQRDMIQTIKKVVMISIMMQNRNSKCNALESVFGIFLHSTNTPEKVINTLARMGVSISISAIHSAIHALSSETYETLRDMGQTLLVGYAYDNFDIDFKVTVPTIEKAGDTLTHLTSGTMIVLEHGVALDDLKCSEELWDKSPLNPMVETPAPRKTCVDLETLHPEIDHISGLTRRERFNSWMFKSDLFKAGPLYFKAERTIVAPETVDQIPVVKMQYAPTRSMDINQSSHAGNISAVENLLDQGGVGAPEEDPEKEKRKYRTRHLISLMQYVVLFFGDLGTFERVMGIVQRRSIEATPWWRYQFIVFVMGLFHLKMACADAIWRIFIEPKRAKDDETSLMSFVTVHRPRETGKIGSNPGFRRMHEVIGHDGIALRLDAWRVEAARRNPLWLSLEDFAASSPTQALIDEMADYLAEHYVAGGEVDIYAVRSKPEAMRDQQHENTLLMHQYFLLYEEMSYAMNQGDIGRVETLFPPWISIFKATGKHKYAAHMTKFLTDVHFVYNARLRHAVRSHLLVNPTGKPGKFRGVDWVEESMINLATKHTFGGSGSNYTKARVIEESTLIKIYHSCHENIERNFCLSSLSSRHAPPDMRKTFKLMATYLQTHSPHVHQAGRKSAYPIPDVLDRGNHLVYNLADKYAVTEDVGNADQAVEEEDLAVEFD